MSAELSRPHIWEPGSGGRPLLLLHGTGGDEHDLLPLGRALSPTSPLLSPRGAVLEGTMPRFFRRLAEGVFDEEDLAFRSDELADFVLAASAEYGVDPATWVAVGFSNGANTAAAMLMRRPEVLSGAVLIAATVPFRRSVVTSDLTGTWALVANGRRDPMATVADTATLVSQLEGLGASVELLAHEGGHGIDQTQLPRMQEAITAGRL